MRTYAHKNTSTDGARGVRKQPRTHAPFSAGSVLLLRVWQSAEFGVGVHAGYAEIADELYLALHQQMQGLIAKDTAIHVTGHSMGGAVSLILAMRLVATGYLVSQVLYARLCVRARTRCLPLAPHLVLQQGSPCFLFSSHSRHNV